MKVAIVHHWFVSQGGGERVAEVLAEMYPSADIFTLVADPGLALFCGLNAMPKKSFLSEYSSRITRQKVLRLLGASGGLSQQQLSTRLGIHPSRLVAILDALEEQRLVERQPNLDDRRQYALHKWIQLVLGGVLLHLDPAGLGWRTVFLINVPIGAAVLTLARRHLPESRAPKAERKSSVPKLRAMTPGDARSMNGISFELDASSSVIGRSMMPPSMASVPPKSLMPV